MRKLNRFAPIKHNEDIHNKTFYNDGAFYRFCDELSDNISGIVQEYFKTHDNPTAYNKKSAEMYTDGLIYDSRVELFDKLKEAIEEYFTGPIEILDIDFTRTEAFGSISFFSKPGIVEDLYFHKPQKEKIYIREREVKKEYEYYDIPDSDKDPLTNNVMDYETIHY